MYRNRMYIKVSTYTELYIRSLLWEYDTFHGHPSKMTVDFGSSLGQKEQFWHIFSLIHTPYTHKDRVNVAQRLASLTSKDII